MCLRGPVDSPNLYETGESTESLQLLDEGT